MDKYWGKQEKVSPQPLTGHLFPSQYESMLLFNRSTKHNSLNMYYRQVTLYTRYWMTSFGVLQIINPIHRHRCVQSHQHIG